MTDPRNNSSRTAGDRTGTAAHSSLAALVSAITDGLAGPFATMDWAEDEIARAIGRHPGHADVLYHAFGLLRPRELGPGMTTELVYRSHAAELLERIATGGDTRPATAAKLCLVCAQASQLAPMHGAAAGLYLRLWLAAFPHHPITTEHAEQQAHYEHLYGPRIDELEGQLRRKTADPHRKFTDIHCAGRHHGQQVACRFATSQSSAAQEALRETRSAYGNHKRLT